MPDELRHALPFEVGSPNLKSDNIPSIRALLTYFHGPIVVDKEASTVHLIPSIVPPCSHRAFWYRTVHPSIAETCLNPQLVKALSTCPSPDLQRTPFLHIQRTLSISSTDPFPNILLYTGESKQKGPF